MEASTNWKHVTAPAIRGTNEQVGIDLFDDEESGHFSIYVRYKDGTRYPARTVAVNTPDNPLHASEVLEAWSARGIVKDYRTNKNPPVVRWSLPEWMSIWSRNREEKTLVAISTKENLGVTDWPLTIRAFGSIYYFDCPCAVSVASVPNDVTGAAEYKVHTLRRVLPLQFLSGSFDNTPAFALKDVEVEAEHGGMSDANFVPWPGPHKNVHYWVELANGKCVGFNEHPSRGWSFPVINRK